ncbi:NAD(P)-dependent alcohol dehydrogenase [Sphingobium estronivorans]|uniref:NAD(P)-dependent alcohol dehydrogenase n=1 Tax=Sphingobium estronivorans TaxID=1577690 RepID=UPI00123C271F|nr:NAD(P)-dependent alcohol dehydrogenase [Sphingobium estronivorans]
MKIRAAVSNRGDDRFSIEELDLDEPRPDEILVRIEGVGLCHTDLVFRDAGDLLIAQPALYGHEGAGIVEAVGSAVSKVRPGDAVAISFRSCGTCDRCSHHDASYCRSAYELNWVGARTDGSKALHRGDEEVASNFFGQSSFATHCLTYERNVVRLPDDVPVALMGPLGCGVQTGVGAVMNSLAAPKGSTILIVGGGTVGLCAVMGARIVGCSTIILVEPKPARRELGREFGATHCIDPAQLSSLSAAVREILPQGVDFALDVTGIPAVLEQIPACLGSKGVLGLVGVVPPGTPMPGDAGTAVTFGLSIKGIIEGDSNPDEFIPVLIDHYKAGRLPFDRLITTYPLSDINKAVKDQHDGKCIKPVLIPEAAGTASRGK